MLKEGAIMPYICKRCKNKNDFRRNEYGSCNWSETVYLDEELERFGGDGMEYDNHDSSDSDPVECSDCGSTNVEDVELEEWEAWDGPETNDPEVKEEGESWKDYMKRRNKVK